MDALLRLATKLWLRRYKKRKAAPSVRAILLGDSVSTRVITDGVFSGNEIAALEQFVFPQLKSHSVALDIGANIGNHAARFSPHFEKLYAFEINEVVFHILQSNAVGTNITPVHVGLSDQAGEVSFAENFENMGGSRIETEQTSAGKPMRVMRLDDFLAEEAIADVSFVKIDVEGHEFQVFQGGAAFFKREQPVLAFEAHFGSNPEEGARIQKLLQEFGYSQFWEMVPKSQFMRRLEDTYPKPIRNAVRMFLPKSVRKDLMLSPCEHLEGENRDLVIASTFDLG